MTVPARPANGLLVNLLIGFGVLIVIALPVGLIGGGLHTRHQVEPVAGGITTTGTVTSISSDEELHGKNYTPTITFTDSRGHVHLFDGPTDTNSHPPVGTKVKVSYDPANPDHASDISAGSKGWEITVWIGVAVAVAELILTAWVIKRRIGIKRRAAT
jgi:hypothetical protein